ncbi:MAG: nicotinate phosphoribosyltransferase [Bacteroidota bacterium]
MTSPFKSYRASLLTDLYQLTMAYGYWQQGLQERQAVFHLFFRKNPFKGPFAVCSGLESAIEYLQAFEFSAADVQYLGRLKGSDGQLLFNESFLNYLQRLSFSCQVSAIPEGTVVFPHSPLVRVEGPLLQAQLIETALLTLVNFSTLIATKAARIVRAAQGDAVLEFGLRRAQGIDGGLSASRAAYIGGCAATSNVLAGARWGIPVKGTHAHSWVMAFEQEQAAFDAYAEALPNNCIFLVDTYDTLEGVKKAIKTGLALREKGYEMNGIRLDSGDLAQLSRAARALLDEAGFKEAKIFASNDLEEEKISALKADGAAIDVWGVGTKLATSYDQPALGGVYKLAALKDADGQWQDKIKLSENPIKTSIPGKLQCRRFYEGDQPVGDLIWDEKTGLSAPFQGIQLANRKVLEWNDQKQEDLLQVIFEKGQLVYQNPNIKAIRKYCIQQQARFEHLYHEPPYPLALESGLFERRQGLIERLNG